MVFKFVFIALLDQGHLQICVSLGKYLLFKDPKNEIYFVTDKEVGKKIKEKCSQFRTLEFEEPESLLDKKGFENGIKAGILVKDNKERFENSLIFKGGGMINMWRSRKELIQDLVKQVNPDFIFIENLFNLPFLMNLGYKWAVLNSANPLAVADQINYPPTGSGVNEDFKWYTEMVEKHGASYRNLLDEFYKESGLTRKPSLCSIEPSPYLNAFTYPKPLNYFEPEQLDGKWLQICSTIVRDEVSKFVSNQGWNTEKVSNSKDLLTPEFLNKSGKLILFSVGTLVSNIVEIFEKLLPILANCPHKFIVSKGKNGDQFQLPSNCVGDNYLNQTELLPFVDLFITHGGNNSVTESCFYGIPMIIIPGFADQWDNACRVETFEIGKKLLFHDISSDNLNSTIDYVTTNESIKKKMKEISEVVQQDDGLDKLTDLVIEVCSKT